MKTCVFSKHNARFYVSVYIVGCVNILDIYADTESKRVKEKNEFTAEVAHTPANRLKRRIEGANKENKKQDGKYIANILCPSKNKICIFEYVYNAQGIYFYLHFRYRIEKCCHIDCPFCRVSCGGLHVSLSFVEQGNFNVSFSFCYTVF